MRRDAAGGPPIGSDFAVGTMQYFVHRRPRREDGGVHARHYNGAFYKLVVDFVCRVLHTEIGRRWHARVFPRPDGHGVYAVADTRDHGDALLFDLRYHLGKPVAAACTG